MIERNLLLWTAGEVGGAAQASTRSMWACLAGVGAVRAARARVEQHRLRLKTTREG